MILLTVSDLTLAFAGQDILSGIGFAVHEGDRLGILGNNGVGKTSLMRAIAGQLSPARGEIHLAHGATVGYLPQNTAETNLSGRDSVLSYMYAAFPELLADEEKIAVLEARAASASEEEGVSLSRELEAVHRRFHEAGGNTFRSRCRAMLLRMGFTEPELSLPVSALSGGQSTRLALSRLLCREPDLLMLDEPTNHLDTDALHWLEEFLASYRKTVLLISHDRYFLDRVTNCTLYVEQGSTRLYPGGYSKARALRDAERATQEKAYREQQKEIARIRANIEFQRRCGQEHNFVTIRSKEKQIARMDRIEAVRPEQRPMHFRFSEEEERGAGNAVQASDLCFSFGGKPLIEHLSFLIRRGERALFLGPNGCGKSTLMKLMTGALLPVSGKLRIGENIRFGYYDQENRTLQEENTVFGQMRDAYPRMTDGELRTVLARFHFGSEDLDKPVRVLSGGERARLSLAVLMLRPVNLLILDEPTNHLDIASREVLEEAISEFSGTVIAVSHDRYFIDRIATRLIELDPHAEDGCRDYPLSPGEGAYSCYLRLREEAAAAKQAANPGSRHGGETEAKRQYEQSKREAAERRAKERKRAQATERIPILEAELDRLGAELYGPAASDYVRAAEIETARTRIEEELLSLYEITMEG